MGCDLTGGVPFSFPQMPSECRFSFLRIACIEILTAIFIFNKLKLYPFCCRQIHRSHPPLCHIRAAALLQCPLAEKRFPVLLLCGQQMQLLPRCKDLVDIPPLQFPGQGLHRLHVPPPGLIPAASSLRSRCAFVRTFAFAVSIFLLRFPAGAQRPCEKCRGKYCRQPSSAFGFYHFPLPPNPACMFFSSLSY